MIRSSLRKRARVSAWCRRKARLIALTLCVALVLVFVSVSFSNQALPKSNLVSFDCHISSSGQTFSIEVEVELSDGMDQEEATSVAIIAFKEKVVGEFSPEEHLLSLGSNAILGSDGLWTVKLKYTHMRYGLPPTHDKPTIVETQESFEAIINPINRTVECSAF